MSNIASVPAGTPGPNNTVSTYVQKLGDAMTGDLTVPDESYGSSWNGSTEVPTKNAVYDKIESVVTGAGTGDVTGPASSTDNALARFDATSGKTIQNSNATLSDAGSLTLAVDLPITEGGTGASSASTARSNLGITKSYLTVGSTDSDYITDGVADDVQINAALLAATTNGGVVHVKPGTYEISATITCKSNVVLEGEGVNATIFRLKNSTSVHMFTITSVSNSTFRQFQVDGNKANNVSGTHLFRIDTNGRNLLFEDLYIHDSPQHGIIANYATGPHTGITVNRVKAADMGVTASGSGSGFYMLYCVDLKMSNITSTGNELDGIQWGDLPGPADEIQLSNINVHDNLRYGIYVPSGHCNITNLTAYNNAIGVLVQQDATMNLNNAEVYSNLQDGVRIDDSNYSTITNVRSYNNGQGGSTSAGLRLTAATASTCNGHSIINCKFFDSQGTATQDYGIWASGAGTIDLNNVASCQCFSNASTQFRRDTWSVTNTIVNVLGLNPNKVLSHGNLTGSKTFDRANGHYQRFTLTGDLTATITSGAMQGDTMIFQITQDSSGSHVITWPSNFKKAGGTLTLSTAANAVDEVMMVWDSSNWREVSRSMNLS